MKVALGVCVGVWAGWHLYRRGNEFSMNARIAAAAMAGEWRGIVEATKIVQEGLAR